LNFARKYYHFLSKLWTKLPILTQKTAIKKDSQKVYNDTQKEIIAITACLVL
jgi:hypothetical protein